MRRVSDLKALPECLRGRVLEFIGATRQNVAHFGACSTPGMPTEARFGIDSGAARQNVERFPVGA